MGSSDGDLTQDQLREAERRLRGYLFHRNFPREWIDRHVPDLMAQAHAEFAARIAAKREWNSVGLLPVMGYRRAIKQLESDRRRPSVSIEKVFHLPDPAARTPEQKAIDRERRRLVAEALHSLSEKERELITAVYFEGMSIRAAGRRLGWGKSAANEHHQAALHRLRPFFSER